MNIARASIEKPIFTWIVILGCLLGGLWGFFSLGRLEDPAFTIKTAVVVTQYPGASAHQVAREVSEPLESEIQKMSEVKRIESMMMKLAQKAGTQANVSSRIDEFLSKQEHPKAFKKVKKAMDKIEDLEPWKRALLSIKTK